MDIFVNRLRCASTIFAPVLTTFCVLAPMPLWAEEPRSTSTEAKPAPQAAEAQFARKLIGAWTRRAVPRGWSSKVTGTEFKFFSDKHWIVTHSDESGFALYTHGGTYDLVGDKYTEKITFSTLYNARMIGQVNEFKIDVDGNTYWQIGLDNEYTEKWTRANDGNETQLARDLIGAWTRTAIPFDDAPKAKYVQYKFLAGKHWIAIDTNKSGLALTSHGGTYTLDGDECTEKVTYSTQFSVHQIGKMSKFQVVVKGDTLLQVGLDDQLTEKWTRARE